MAVYQATSGQQLSVPIGDETGQQLEDYTVFAVVEGAIVASPAETLSMTLVEVDDAEAPGFYLLTLTPPAAGLLYLTLSRGEDEWELVLQVAHEGLDLLGAAQAGAEGNYTVTLLDDLEAPIDGAVVKVYSASGSRLVARGLTNSEGAVTFGLPVGTYYVRAYKTGYNFTSVNPSEITVISDDESSPVLAELVPESATAGGPLAVRGHHFGDAPEVSIDGTWYAAEVDSTGSVAVVTVPEDAAALTTVRVRKADPNNPGEYLQSGAMYLEVA